MPEDDHGKENRRESAEIPNNRLFEERHEQGARLHFDLRIESGKRSVTIAARIAWPMSFVRSLMPAEFFLVTLR
jgi:hypothetical protein